MCLTYCLWVGFWVFYEGVPSVRCGFLHSIKLPEYLPCMRTQVEGSRDASQGVVNWQCFSF